MSATQCLEKVVGLSIKDCPCTPDKPEAIKAEGVSGEYIDDSEHCVALSYPVSGNCTGTIWELMAEARKASITNFIIRYQQELAKSMTSQFKVISDKIGKKPSSYYAIKQGLSTGKDIVGFYIRPNKYRGIYQNLRTLYLHLDTAGIYTVKVIDIDNPGTNIKEVPVTIEADVKKEVEFEVRLPYSVKGVRRTYAIYYDRQGAKPYNTKFSCGCGATSEPTWLQMKHFAAGGFELDSITDLDISGKGKEYTYGIELDFSFECSSMGWMCAKPDTFWTQSEYGIIAAKILAKYAANHLQDDIMTREVPSPYTLIDGDTMVAKMERNLQMINEYMPLLVKNSEDATDCYECKNKGYMQLEKGYF